MSVGVYNLWVDKSIDKLAILMPARYAKREVSTGFIDTIGPFRYQSGAEVSRR